MDDYLSNVADMSPDLALDSGVVLALQSFAEAIDEDVDAAIGGLVPNSALITAWKHARQPGQNFADWLYQIVAAGLKAQMRDRVDPAFLKPSTLAPVADKYLLYLDALAREAGRRGPLGSHARFEAAPPGGYWEAEGVRGADVLPSYRHLTADGYEECR